MLSPTIPELMSYAPTPLVHCSVCYHSCYHSVITIGAEITLARVVTELLPSERFDHE